MREVLDHLMHKDRSYSDSRSAYSCIFWKPVFRYGIDEAIRQGYLVDYDGIAVHSGVKVKGIFLRKGNESEQSTLKQALKRWITGR